MQFGWRLSAVILAAGLLKSVIQQDALPERLGSPADVFRGLADLDSISVVGLGILAVILTPIATAATMALTVLGQRDTRHALISGLVLAILVGSIVLSVI